ncbi:MAG: helix-turn-helix transcriptional regulator [Clostridia bacterium]|nr:helix-turn-helix transcriptional regulator [Clostridia bacterium]
MKQKIVCAKLNKSSFPLHSHTSPEVIVYSDIENGFMHTSKAPLPCKNGSIAVIPPNAMHGTKCDTITESICLRGDFLNIPPLDDVVIVEDNASKEGYTLAKLIYNNRFSNHEYLISLCHAFSNFLTMNMDFKTDADRAVSEIISELSEAFSNPALSVGDILDKSGYARDYIRDRFKKITQKTPTEFLTEARISHACFLIAMCQSSVSLSEIALKCGYSDYIYFSRNFKAIMGVSPKEYRKNNG